MMKVYLILISACVCISECMFVIEKVDNPCKEKANGKYNTRNSFEYMVCKNEKASYVSCGYQLYDPHTQSCVPSTSVDATNFCRYRPNGDYNWPWNCHRYITCSNHYFYPFNCSTPELVYDPTSGRCKHPDEVKCKEIKEFEENGICSDLPDGQYSFGSVFHFVTCKNKKATVTECPTHTIFVPSSQKCVSIFEYKVDNFCLSRKTMNWQNPWNCHSYIACVYEKPYVIKCQQPELVFNSDKNMCVDPSKYTCREERKFLFISESVNVCTNLPDGKYATRDIYQYLQCTNHEAKYIPCVGQVYDPASKTCVDYDRISRDTFCRNRPNNNYNDPWNCHRFVTCSNGNFYLFNCSEPDLVYDPKTDRCRHEDEVPCKKIDDPCASKPDGKYYTRDIFKYMICKDGISSSITCKDEIYDPCAGNCVSPSTVNAKNFCNCRRNGNYMDPWNCHSYVTCSNHLYSLFNCSIKALVYDPDTDRCEHPDKRICKQVKTEYFSISESIDVCTNLPDGKYATRDIYQYLQCTNHKAKYIPCIGQVYDPASKTCVDYDKISRNTFCRNRPNNNYNDPWNCHRFVTCSNGNFYLFNCSEPDLVYDPKTDRCRHEDEVPCKKIDDPCASKPDGKYYTRDIFKYMICKGGISSNITCKDEIYDPCAGKCVSPSTVNVKNFCNCRRNGNYMDPWNCHSYVTCSNHLYNLFNCSIKALVYDPDTDRCEHPDKRICKQVKLVKSRQLFHDEKNPCQGKSNGKYNTRNSFEYMVCKDEIASYVSCGYQLYDPHKQSCVPSSSVDATNFCRFRPNGDYNWPWNCHRYITCSNHNFYPFKCSTPELVYDPTSGRCKHPDEVKCKEIKELVFDTKSGRCKHQVKCKEIKRANSSEFAKKYVAFTHREWCPRTGISFHGTEDKRKVQVCMFGRPYFLYCRYGTMYEPRTNACKPLSED